MHIATLVSVLEHPHLAAEHLHRWGVRDLARARQTLEELAETGLTLDLLAAVCDSLAEHLPATPDPDEALTAFRRYLFAVRSPLALAALLERDDSAMPMLLAALSLGPRWANLLAEDPDAFDLLRQTETQPLDREALAADVLAEVTALADERALAIAIARLRRRHTLRIAYGDLVGGWPLATVMEQLSQLAEALLEAALKAAQRSALAARPLPIDSSRWRATIIALGRLGAGELDYASPLDLLVVYDAAETDAAAFRAVQDVQERAARLLVRYLSDAGGGEAAYQVRLVALPDSTSQASAHAAEDAFIGYDSLGRTWHRQALLKARSVAGDRRLGEVLLARLQNWLFRRYLSPADEAGAQALKRRIVMSATLHQDDWRSPHQARGGLRDLEGTVEFLQLLSGGDEPALRQRSTARAIAELGRCGVISAAERQVLEESHAALRRLEHGLQIVPPQPLTELPADAAVMDAVARRMGRASAGEMADLERQAQSRCWETLRKLLGSAFEREPPPPREVELLLDPAPPPEEVRAALAPFGFNDPAAALATLQSLAAEHVPFLSTRRCRHLLASILPRLLREISATPNPDRTLDSLALVTGSLGSKGVMWDLFRFHPPSLALYVRLCAASPYLSELLTTNPGMLDELVDSLQLDKLPTRGELQATLDELCRHAADTLSVLHDFKNAQHLRIGVRDILGKEDVDRTHLALADVSEICLGHVAELEWQKLVEKFGQPTLGPGPREGEPCHLVIVGLGKLGGREPNYHSHLDFLFLYEGEGTTRPAGRSRQAQRTANNHFFTQLAQRIGKVLADLTPKGRLYSVEASLRPLGVGGALAMSLADFQEHFASGAAPLWQWQALCQARPVWGEAAVCERVERMIRQMLSERPPPAAGPEELRQARLALERGASVQNLKRGPGGTLDIEFLVQLLQLESAARNPQVLCPNTQAAIPLLAAAGAIPPDLATQLGDSYRFLRRVESGLRLLNTQARHDLPGEGQPLAQLALLLGHGNPGRLREQCLAHMAANRQAFDRITRSSSP
ncbi:MAG TPA: hypothetical protein VFB80_05700 [Pirellulaceae bacterium]|nr:hypothetical protein [Pirellulaceae bacterium]